MWSGCMVSPRTSSLTVVPNSRQRCGGPSAGALRPQSTYHRDTIPRPTDRRSGLTRLWRSVRYHQQPSLLEPAPSLGRVLTQHHGELGLPLPTISRKLAPRYVGPYTIDKVINPSALRLTLPPSLKIHPVFHVSQVKPVATSDLSLAAPAPPPPRTLEGSDLVWEVNRILAVHRRGRGVHYLVDWVGYGLEDRTWVSRSYFVDPALLEEFYWANPQAIGRSPGVSRREGGPVAGASVAMPPTQPARPKKRADELISSPELISDSCTQLNLPTRTRQDQQSGQQRS